MNDPLIPSFGGHQSPPDYRDLPIAAAITAPVTRPPMFFVDVSQLPVWNQKKRGACTGHAGAKYKQLIDWIETGNIIAYSPRFPYALTKMEDGIGLGNEGTYPRTIAKQFKNIGCATEATVPNDTDLDFAPYVFNLDRSKIPAAAFTEAPAGQISGYAFPNAKNADELKDAIIHFRGAMLLLQLGKEWWTKKDGSSSSWAEADVIPLRPPQATVSGHEVYLFAYEDVVENGRNRTKFYIFNSWSADWGKKGISYFYFDEYAPWLIECITFVDLPNDLKQRLHDLPSAETFKHDFETDIELGQTTDEVKALQTALLIDGEFDRDLYTQLLKGNNLGYYGDITRQAVRAFQFKYKVAPASELNEVNGRRVGLKTRIKLNQLFK